MRHIFVLWEVVLHVSLLMVLHTLNGFMHCSNFMYRIILTRNTICGMWYLPHSHVHNKRTVAIMGGCIAHARNCCIFTSGLKSDVTVEFQIKKLKK